MYVRFVCAFICIYQSVVSALLVNFNLKIVFELAIISMRARSYRFLSFLVFSFFWFFIHFFLFFTIHLCMYGSRYVLEILSIVVFEFVFRLKSRIFSTCIVIFVACVQFDYSDNWFLNKKKLIIALFSGDVDSYEK